MSALAQRLRVAARPAAFAARRALRGIDRLLRPPVAWDGRHHPVFERFEPWRGVSDGTYAHDFLGVRTDVRFRPQFRPDPPGPVAPAVPPPHAAYFELVAVLEAVVAARADRPFAMVEAGAGYGHWLAVARRALSARGHGPARLVGIELVPRHFRFMGEHLRANGVPGDDLVLINAAVGDSDGAVEFIPEPDAAHSYGQRIARRIEHGVGGAPAAGTVRVPRVRLATLLAAEVRLDVVHIDIQGEEARVVPDALDELSTRVGRIVLATHSRAIHRRLRGLLRESGFAIDHDFRPGRRERTGFGDVQFLDGLLTARNPRLDG